MLRTCVTAKGIFTVGVHKPRYQVRNLRKQDCRMTLGHKPDGTPHDNRKNFPAGDVEEQGARWIYEIANAFSFCGSTYIDSGWAAARAKHPESIRIEAPPACSLSAVLTRTLKNPQQAAEVLQQLPKPVRYDLAANSTDPEELALLAQSCARFTYDPENRPTGLTYLDHKGVVRPDIDDFEFFETIANNPYLPDLYKEVMVLRPGVQGGSEVVGDYRQEDTHIFEYLRRNSYIPWGHYAANMAHDAIRYRTSDLSPADMRGLRHLYYQRMIVTLADRMGVSCEVQRRSLTEDELEELRLRVLTAVEASDTHPATLWGWNFGYDFSGSGYRLHASHQMIHQQFALVPDTVETLDGGSMISYSCGDQVAEVVAQYRQENGTDFFSDYLLCIYGNERVDRNPENSAKSLIVHRDDNVLLFVPKAQVSQWELQLMVIADHQGGPVGNVLEAATAVRRSIDRAILVAQHIFAGLGAKMVTSLEYSKRLGLDNGQRLLYAFLPKLPWSMGAFSEAQQRFICGHFPEDFAAACRAVKSDMY